MLEAELGFKGERGLSNYEIAVKNGYTGTEQEWLASFGVDFNVCVMKDDIEVISGTIDYNDPDEPVFRLFPYLNGWDKDNTICLSIKTRDYGQSSWNDRPLHSGDSGQSIDYYTSTLQFTTQGIIYKENWYELLADTSKFDFQITLMKVNIPLE